MKFASREVYSKKPGERSETISIAVCANASGNIILPPFVIFKQSCFTTSAKIDEFPADTTFSCSDSGYIVSDLFIEWLKVFNSKIPPTRPVLLIIDGRGSYVTREAITFSKNNFIELFCLPPHTTHKFQPFDVAVFKSLKDKFRHQAVKYLRKHKCKVKKACFGKIFTPAYL